MGLFKKKSTSSEEEAVQEVLNEDIEVSGDESSENAEDTGSGDDIDNTDNTEEDEIDNEEDKPAPKKFWGFGKKRGASSNSDDEEGQESESEEPTRSLPDMVDELIDYFTVADPIKLNALERGKIRKEEFMLDVDKYIREKITRDEDLHVKLVDSFSSFVWRYDILDELIDDDEISDIKIYRWDHIRIKRLGKRETSPVKFRSEKHYLKFVEHTAIKNKVSIADQNAAQNFVDKESSDKAILRFNITTGFINSNGKYLMSIRKILKHKYTSEDLIKAGMFTKEQEDYLIKRINTAGGLLVAGKGGSGKTTLINHLLDKIDPGYSCLVIQENEELFSQHPDMAFQHTVMNRGEGKIEYNLKDLARNGLLMDLDYFVIGEIKGEEALYLLNAVYTGARGIATVHGASSMEAMKKLVDYIKYNSDYTQEEALQMLVHLDTIVFIDNFKIKEISEVVRYDEQKHELEYKRIY